MYHWRMMTPEELSRRLDRPPSPCTKVCTLDSEGFCAGCLRTGAEIGGWLSMTAAEQWQLLAELDARRRSRQKSRLLPADEPNVR
jgi:uncharacterized protein